MFSVKVKWATCAQEKPAAEQSAGRSCLTKWMDGHSGVGEPVEMINHQMYGVDSAEILI